MKKSTTDEKRVQYVIAGTFRQCLAGFLVDRQSQGLARGTIRYYRDELERFAVYLDLVGVVAFEEITALIFRQYLLYLGQEREGQPGRSPGGVHAAFRAIRALLNWYEKEFEPADWKNPVKKVRGPKVSKNPLPGVSVETIGRMIRACKKSRDRLILMMLFDTGCRAAELMALNVGDCDLINGAVRIRRGKGGKARTVFLGGKSRKALRAYLKERGPIEAGDPLFLSQTGERLTYGGLVHVVRDRAENAGVDPLPGVHDFRRAFALAMLRNGVDLARLAELMGHGDLEILRRYLALVDDDLRLAHAQGSPVDRSDI